MRTENREAGGHIPRWYLEMEREGPRRTRLPIPRCGYQSGLVQKVRKEVAWTESSSKQAEQIPQVTHAATRLYRPEFFVYWGRSG